MSHARSSQPALPTFRAMSAETMKMPEPIIEPDDDHRRVVQAEPAREFGVEAVADAAARVSDI